jgi:cellulose biosynthesis protein BcsQ
MSPKVVAVANTAGGSAKTTLAHALAVATVEYGKKTNNLGRFSFRHFDSK